MLYTLRLFFSSKCSLFHNANLFGSCIIHILYTGCVEIKKNNSGAKRLRERQGTLTVPALTNLCVYRNQVIDGSVLCVRVCHSRSWWELFATVEN